MGSVETEGLRKEYPGVVAVDDVDLEVRDGEFFALLGPSGCGKTTTLRMISGFETPTAGRVRIDGSDVTDAPPETRPTNMVFQDLALFTHMNTHDNVAYGLRRAGLDEEAIEDRVAEALELVDMPGYGDRAVDDLSGGQQQRVALARALANRPDVILLDEPLASLDRRLRQQMQLELRTIHEEVGMTFFYVTHDQQAAMTMADRMAVMNDGHIEQVGPPAEVYDDPASEFVADFIGDMNRFVGRVEKGVFLTDWGAEFALPTSARTQLADGGSRKASLVVRPEKLQVSTDGLDMSNTTKGIVRDAVFRGTATRYEIDLNDGPTIDVEAQNISRGSLHADGDRVTVGWDPDAAILYER